MSKGFIQASIRFLLGLPSREEQRRADLLNDLQGYLTYRVVYKDSVVTEYERFNLNGPHLPNRESQAAGILTRNLILKLSGGETCELKKHWELALDTRKQAGFKVRKKDHSQHNYGGFKDVGARLSAPELVINWRNIESVVVLPS